MRPELRFSFFPLLLSPRSSLFFFSGVVEEIVYSFRGSIYVRTFVVTLEEFSRVNGFEMNENSLSLDSLQELIFQVPLLLIFEGRRIELEFN